MLLFIIVQNKFFKKSFWTKVAFIKKKIKVYLYKYIPPEQRVSRCSLFI